jgi:hypothetical protein
MFRLPMLLALLAPTAVLCAAGDATSEEDDAGPIDLTEVARHFPRHPGMTVLYVNFDGWTDYDGNGHDVEPYRPHRGGRDRAIQLILLRTAEKYAPFDVAVRRLRGDGNRDRRPLGNTTVFVGADTRNVNDEKGKFTYAHTQGHFVDHPGTLRGDAHAPNSDPYDLAFVDPVGQRPGSSGTTTLWNEDRIARAIAHEAGHTFGLAHTDTAAVQDVMSYDAPNHFFANRVFPITTRNYTGTGIVHTDRFVPRWAGRQVAMQNSYTYLRAALGDRLADDHPNLADRTAVDPTFACGRPTPVLRGEPRSGVIDYRGDYDVFGLSPETPGRLVVEVRPAPGTPLVPVLFVFDAAGRDLVGFANGREDGSFRARVAFTADPGESFKVVVGAADCASTGEYEVYVHPAVSGELAKTSDFGELEKNPDFSVTGDGGAGRRE